jgi:hypothetical protein
MPNDYSPVEWTMVEMDKPRRFAFTPGSMRRLKAEHPDLYTLIREGKEDEIDPMDAPLMLWAMLHKEDRDIDSEDFADLFDASDMVSVVGILNRVMSDGKDEPAEEGDGAAQGKKKSARSTSI